MAAEQSAERELVMRVVEIIEREGLQGIDIHFAEICAPELEWRPTMVGTGTETYVGREGYRHYLEELVTSVTNVSFRVDDVRDADGGRVLVLGHLTLAGRDGSDPVESEYALLCEVEGGRLRAATAFAAHAAAEEAAGA
ncbi:MAG TPA: nuclear transport factor 2 family protein [Solirubrobacterales bacterium]